MCAHRETCGWRSMCRGRRSHIRPAHSTTPTYTAGKDSPAREPSWSAFWLQETIQGVCVFITAGPITKLFAWGRRRVEDKCYERRQAEACVDESAHHAQRHARHDPLVVTPNPRLSLGLLGLLGLLLRGHAEKFSTGASFPFYNPSAPVCGRGRRSSARAHRGCGPR